MRCCPSAPASARTSGSVGGCARRRGQLDRLGLAQRSTARGGGRSRLGPQRFDARREAISHLSLQRGRKRRAERSRAATMPPRRARLRGRACRSRSRASQHPRASLRSRLGRPWRGRPRGSRRRAVHAAPTLPASRSTFASQPPTDASNHVSPTWRIRRRASSRWRRASACRPSLFEMAPRLLCETPTPHTSPISSRTASARSARSRAPAMSPSYSATTARFDSSEPTFGRSPMRSRIARLSSYRRRARSSSPVVQRASRRGARPDRAPDRHRPPEGAPRPDRARGPPPADAPVSAQRQRAPCAHDPGALGRPRPRPRRAPSRRRMRRVPSRR